MCMDFCDKKISGKKKTHRYIIKYKLTKNIVSAVTWLSQQTLDKIFFIYNTVFIYLNTPVLPDN